ncbi:hypothetical protein PL751_08045 [Bifidobacterium bifidum]|uniref:hypothetical protein n=1 Tax=Bifidobacterium bifidum TaxID=1681 RepID=UPI00232E7162|nr:hypothetical protein [Bifidobacterium bifidum]MDB1243191.1 hypothetical protein [Bifidobacterium bifidum]MDB1274432.1 hypothetical protein [Bifidobacterium bifidum]MDB1277960.1 hypothetical protein [Bifidobacterium bifidum]MDB1280037.1 hypothetical protein [Bifidobacterium bifidum]MDB1283263.1 hypothetical protein [Bifidobacterium bifidum]
MTAVTRPFDKMGDDLEHQIGDNRADDDGDHGLSQLRQIAIPQDELVESGPHGL